MIKNGFLNTSIQKGGIPGFTGCLEHVVFLSQMMHKARSRERQPDSLDLANAFGSIPHSLIRTALNYYHMPDHIKGMTSTYMGGIKLRFKTRDYDTQWHEPYYSSGISNQRSNDGLW